MDTRFDKKKSFNFSKRVLVNTNSDPLPLLIVGLHRKATSAIALALHECGPFKMNLISYLFIYLLNFITDSLLNTCAGKYDSCPNYKHYNKDTTPLTTDIV